VGVDGWVSCYAFQSLAYTGFTLKIVTLSHLWHSACILTFSSSIEQSVDLITISRGRFMQSGVFRLLRFPFGFSLQDEQIDSFKLR
jgi:hypothetical protein